MANQIPQLKADWLTALNANLDAPTRTEVADIYITELFPSEWAAYIRGGGTDTPANRGTFVVNMMVRQISVQIQSVRDRRNRAAVPPATGLE